MFLIAGGGALSVAFLPETLGATLPETLEEASTFGTKDKFFSYLPKREDEKEKKGICHKTKFGCLLPMGVARGTGGGNLGACIQLGSEIRPFEILNDMIFNLFGSQVSSFS